VKRHRPGLAEDAEAAAAPRDGQPRHAGVERLLTTAEVAEILRVSQRTVIRMLDDGRLKKVKGLGRAVRLHPRTLRNLSEAE
jgi:excisionase family DNA binding protein